MTYPIPRRSSCRSRPRTSVPSIAIVPLVGSMSRLIIRNVVVLPEPDDPSSASTPPVGTSSERSSTASVPSGNRFVTPSSVITVALPSQTARKGVDHQPDILAERVQDRRGASRRDVLGDLGVHLVGLAAGGDHLHDVVRDEPARRDHLVVRRRPCEHLTDPVEELLRDA